MTNEEKELVEMMAIKWHGLTLWNKLSDNEKSQGRAKMFRLVEMVKSNIGKIAELCDCKVNYYQKCPKCHGTGITLKGK